MTRLEICTKEDFEKLERLIADLRNEINQLKELKSPKEFITRKEAAEILKVSVTTVINYEKRGIIIAYRIGNRIRYKREDILNAPVAIERARSY